MNFKLFNRLFVLLMVACTLSLLTAQGDKPAFAQGGSPTKDVQALLNKAQNQGSVLIIVGLDVSFQPEGKLGSSQAVQAQQASIAQKQDELLQSLSGQNVRVTSRFRFIPFIALEVDAAALSALASNPLVIDIQENALNPPALDDSVPLVNADLAHINGYTGSGWTVAILDTGVDGTHNFLSGKVVSEALLFQQRRRR